MFSKIMLSLAVLMSMALTAAGQNTLKFKIVAHPKDEPLAGVSVATTSQGSITNADGVAELGNLPNGKTVVQFSFVGYSTVKKTFNLPQQSGLVVEIELEPDEEELEEVIVTTTRGSRNIADEPTRLEVIGAEELEEKSDMNSSNISTMLKETPGIQVQQTSATSANMTFRIQGLDGRYTQLLLNGLPLYAGFSGGLSVMQIPPLDLKQVEIIKGSASTLYGGGAIAGLVNLVQKEPTETRDLQLMLNGTSAGGLDLNAFYGQKFKKIGLTLFASRNTQRAYDPNSDGFSDIPQSERLNVNPRLFFYFSDKTKLNIGLNASVETRKGGDLQGIKGEMGDFYTETNQSNRLATQLRFDHRIGENTSFFVKNSLSWFNRDLGISVNNYQFGGRQSASFSEMGLSVFGDKIEWVGGLNLWTDSFQENPQPRVPLRDYNVVTAGVFVQNTWKPTEKFTLETGLRYDTYLFDWQDAKRHHFLLPRVSALFKINEKFTSRLGGGLGYKAPTIFTEQVEAQNFKGVFPFMADFAQPEQSAGLNWDVNYNSKIGEVGITFNHLFFYTQIQNPLVLQTWPCAVPPCPQQYSNVSGQVQTRGFETNLKLSYYDFKLYSFYTFTDTKRAYSSLNNAIPLTAKNRVGLVLMWEKHGSHRIGYEAYYFGPQELDNRRPQTRSYWVMGFMAEKTFKKISLYINFENFADTRLSRWQPMFNGPRQNPNFVNEIWAPTDGRVINGGIKMRF